MATVPCTGDGWVHCELGHRHWGRFGAAGLLVVTPQRQVLMQHRAPWSHGGDTWGVPGGALHPGEDPADGARRETVEETGLDPEDLQLRSVVHVDDHRSWRYTTVLATVSAPLAVRVDRESVALRWVQADQVAELPLHPAFAAAWPRLRRHLPS